MNLAPKFG
jgi:hypothetical protein